MALESTIPSTMLLNESPHLYLRIKELLHDLIHLTEQVDLPGFSTNELLLAKEQIIQKLKNENMPEWQGLTHDFQIFLENYIEKLISFNLFNRMLPVPAMYLMPSLLSGDETLQQQFVVNIAFIDIEGYSILTQTLKDNTGTFVNTHFFKPIVHIALKHNVFILEVQGDAIILFNFDYANITELQNCLNEVFQLSLSLKRDYETVIKDLSGPNERFSEKEARLLAHLAKGFNFRLRIGTATGEVSAGITGDMDMRMQWVLRGNTMNMPARLQSTAKLMGVYWAIDTRYYNELLYNYPSSLTHLTFFRYPLQDLRDFPETTYYLVITHPSEKFLKILEDWPPIEESIIEGDWHRAYENLKKLLASHQISLPKNNYREIEWIQYVRYRLGEGEGIFAHVLRELKHRYADLYL